MLHNGVALCHTHDLLIDAVARKRLFTCRALFFLTHRCPHIRDDDVRVLCSDHRVVRQGEAIVTGCKVQDLLRRAVTLRASHSNFHADLQAADDEGVHHIVAVADEAHLQAVERALIFADRHEVR